VAFVPLHPYDVMSRPPINRKEEVFAVNDKNGFSVERIKLDPERKIESLSSPPREFRTVYLAPLAGADTPHMEAHTLSDAFAGSKSTVAKKEGVSLSFDAKSQSFMMSKEVMHGGKSVTVSAPITNHDSSLQARGGSFAGGHGGFEGRGGFTGGGGSSGGVSHGAGGFGGRGGSPGGGGSSGGGSRGGGGSSGGGSSGGGSSGGGSSGGGSSGGGSYGGGGSSGGGSPK
jgi:hypothetical protein